MDNNKKNEASFIDYIKALPQYVLPHFFLSGIMRRVTRTQNKFWRILSIKWVIKQYKVDMSLAQSENINSYKNFNTFFTRKLKPDARPFVSGNHEIACPVDGTVSQAGKIEDGNIFQAKGRHYTLKQLLGHPHIDSTPFEGGQFATIYLSPKDYHRIHMPIDGTLKTMAHIPGRLFSVSPATTRVVPGLFARNERIVTIFETEYGSMAMIPVGAIFVGSIETVWHGEVTPPTVPNIRVWHYGNDEHGKNQNKTVTLKKGDEFGRFNMGSTVVVLFGPQTIKWASDTTANSPVKMGQLLATNITQGA
ncbi:MAG: phosphatidylserine decarboxylase [Gammaproteobacteria bacterium]|nr:phosphatidylserine decarboxylase [Gammaproteobacteria bacterium]